MLKHWCHRNGLWITQMMLGKDTMEGNKSWYLFGNWWWVCVSCIKNNKTKGRNRQCSEARQTTQKGSNWEVTSTFSPHQQNHRNKNLMREITDSAGSTLQSQQQSPQQAENKRCHQHLGQKPGQIPNRKPAAKENSLWRVKTENLPTPQKQNPKSAEVIYCTWSSCGTSVLPPSWGSVKTPV